MAGQKLSVLILFGIVLAHIPLLFLPAVNLEFAFVDAARYLAGGNQALLDQYFLFQANSLGFPALGRLVIALSPGSDHLVNLRLISLSGVLFLWLGVRRLASLGGRSDGNAILLFVLMNPLVWTFSARATADFFPAALAVFAVSLVVGDGRRYSTLVIAGLLLGLAGVLKYHALLLALYVIVLTFDGRVTRRWLTASLLVGGLATAIVAGYVVWAHAAFGFWVTPPFFQHVHQFTAATAVPNFIGYGGYLALLTLPYSLLMPGATEVLRRRWPLILSGTVLLFIVGAFAVPPQVELNFGPLDRFLDSRIVSGAFLVLCAASVAAWLRNPSDDHVVTKRRRMIICATFGILIILAMTRPAQRYLLLLLPFHVLALPMNLNRMRRLLMGTCVGFVIVNGVIGYSQWCTGAATAQLVDDIEAAGLLSVTQAGDIVSHAGNRFSHDHGQNGVPEAKYVVRYGRRDDALLTVTRGVSVLEKTYSLVPSTK